MPPEGIRARSETGYFVNGYSYLPIVVRNFRSRSVAPTGSIVTVAAQGPHHEFDRAVGWASARDSPLTHLPTR